MHPRSERAGWRGLLVKALLLAALALAPPIPARAGGLFRRNSGGALDPGRSTRPGPYDAPVPGVRPPACDPRDHARHAGTHRDPNRVITGLFRYPCLGGYIPASPYRDCLYPSGPHPWQR